MPDKKYKKLIDTNLKNLAVGAKYWKQKDRKEISKWDDGTVADFFRMMVEVVKEDMKSGVRKGTVARAFIESKLPPDDPFNWIYVLRAFTDVHFHNKRGGHIEYDAMYRDVLWDRLRPIVLKQNKRDLLAACRQLVKKYPSEYGGVTAADTAKTIHSRKMKAELNAHAVRNRIKDFEWWPESFDKTERPQ